MSASAPAKLKSKPVVVPKPVVRHAGVVRATHTVKPSPEKHATGRYIEAIGRRKTAVVRVRMYEAPASGAASGITVNEHTFAAYFPIERHRHLASLPLSGASLTLAEVHVTAHASGGGVQAQAEALSLGLARVLIKKEKSWRPRLKALGLLTRDPRMVESKKFGSRKARRPQQWRKR